jgi:hypothetical protein
MSNQFYSFAALAASISMSTYSYGDLSDLYVTNSNGQVYHVDGNTLQATEAVQLQDAGTINEILYLGNGQLVANLSFGVSIYDFNTQTQTSLFSAQEEFGIPGSFTYTSGLAHRSNGDVYFAVNVLADQPNSQYYGVSYNLNTNTATQLADVPGVALIDHHELSSEQMLTASYNDQSVTVFNPDSGVVDATYSLGLAIVSFVQSNDAIYFLTQSGELHTFDPTDGSTGFHGSISGVSGSFIGATIPAPSSLILICTSLFTATRRRRH